MQHEDTPLPPHATLWPTAPQYRDAKFTQALAKLKEQGFRASGPWVLALPRPDLDPSSKIHDTGHVTYKINAKENQVAVMHVLSVGPGRVRLGYREVIPVKEGDLILVNLREAGHWLSMAGETVYQFTGDVAMLRMYRTMKRAEAPQQQPGESDADYRERRNHWHNEWFWNIKDVLNDYMVLGRDPRAETLCRQGPETLIHAPDTALTDGSRSDDARDNRFPIVYRRVLGCGPGRTMRRESDLGIIEREETIPEAEPGDMIALCTSVQAASFIFQGAPLQVIHCSSTLNIKHSEERALELGADSTVVHSSCEQPIPFDEELYRESDDEPEEDLPPTLRGVPVT